MKNRINLITFYTIIAFSIILCGCGKTQFTKETHKREDYFARQFEILTCEKPYGKLCVETEDEKEAAKVEEFVDKRLKASGVDYDGKEYTLMFVSTLPPKGMALADQNILVFPIDDVINGNGNESAQRMLYFMEKCDYWIAYGLAYMNSEADEEALREYYSNLDNLAVLNLSGIRFFDYYQDEDECKIAKQTAIAVVKYASSKGYKSVDSITTNKSELINGWLNSIGVTYSYDGEYKDKVTYYRDLADDDLECIRIDNLIIFLRKGELHDITDVGHMEEYFFHVPDDLAAIRKYVFEKGIAGFEEVNRPITCHKSEIKEATYSYAYLEDKIDLQYWESLPHEYVHIYFSKYNTKDNNFLNEGIAEYLGSMNNNYYMRNTAYEFYQTDLYKEHYGIRLGDPNLIKSVEDVNVSEIYRLQIKEKENDEKACRPLNDESGWTYEESGSLVEYIIEKHSFDDFMKAFTCEGRDKDENDAIIQEYIDEWREDLLKN